MSYINPLSICSQTCKIVKYADNALVLGLISDENENEYKDTLFFVSNWCNENFLYLNVTKTKEMVIDNRKNQDCKEPVLIDNSSVNLLSTYKTFLSEIELYNAKK